MNVRQKIEEFALYCDNRAKEYFARAYSSLDPPRHLVQYGDKWAKIIQCEKNYSDWGKGGGSVYAFIALTEFTTKLLGHIKLGDIHRPASYKAPAKHARGNVFQEGYNGCALVHGIRYL